MKSDKFYEIGAKFFKVLEAAIAEEKEEVTKGRRQSADDEGGGEYSEGTGMKSP